MKKHFLFFSMISGDFVGMSGGSIMQCSSVDPGDGEGEGDEGGGESESGDDVWDDFNEDQYDYGVAHEND